MRIFHSLDGLPEWPGRTVLAIGNFDGVHRGHQAILANVRRRAAEMGAASVALTFDPHPVRVLRPAQAPKLITPLAQKLELLAETGMDATVVIPFTLEFSRLSALQFVRMCCWGRCARRRCMRATTSALGTMPARGRQSW